MAGKVKTWVWVVVGILVIGILCVVAFAAAGIYYFSQHIDAQTVTLSTAESEFDRVRGLYKGQKALIVLDEHGDLVRSNTDRPAPANARRPENLHILAFDPDDGGLVRVTVPFWLLRMKTNNAKINLGRNRLDLEDLKLSVEDLERFGPSLVLDQKSSGGDRVLVWTQ